MARRSRYGIRGRWRWDDAAGQLVQVIGDDAPKAVNAPYIQPDLPEYISPASGLVVSGRRQRREDFKRTGCRPYEGREAEQREAAKRRAEFERREDQAAERAAHQVYQHMPERVRRALQARR